VISLASSVRIRGKKGEEEQLCRPFSTKRKARVSDIAEKGFSSSAPAAFSRDR